MADLDRSDEAQAAIDQMIEGPYMDHHVAYSLGAAFAQLRRPAEAVRWLRHGVR